MKQRSAPVVVSLLLLSSAVLTHKTVFCQVDVTSTSLSVDEVKHGNKDVYNPQGLWPLLSFGAGYMNKGDDVRTEGVPMHVRALGSYYFEGPWIAEVGGGLYNEVLMQRGANGGADTIQALELETAARYKLADRWSVGPVWTTLTGNNRYESNTKNWTSFLGVQVKRDIAWDNEYLVRMGGRFMTDVGVSGEQINAALFEVEVGLGDGSPRVVENAQPPRVIASHLADQAMASGPIIFDGPMNFIENQPTMISSASARADRLARILADNSHLFERVEIVGHADERGTDQYNMKLSERRAESMAHRLRRAGLPNSRLIVEGRGKREPLAEASTQTAWFKNRRVVVRLLGVNDQAAVESLLRSVR